MIILELIYNLSILLAITVVSGLIGQQWKNKFQGEIIQGIVFGAAAIIGMMRPLDFGPGLIFDGRTVMISLCGLFFGPVSVIIAGSLALIFRIFMGGIGLPPGILTITTSAIIGVFFYYRRIRQDKEFSLLQLLWFGIIVHIVMLLCMFSLPYEKAIDVLSHIALPVLITYPAATILIGKVISDQLSRLSILKTLLKSEFRLNKAQEITHIGSWEIDLKPLRIFWSDELYRILGFKPKEIIPSVEALNKVIHPDDRAIFDNAYNSALNEGKDHFEIEFRIIKKQTNEIRYVYQIADIFKNAFNKHIRSIGTIQDITERKLNEEKLKKSEQFLDKIINSFSDPIFVKDRQHRWVLINNALCLFMGYTKAELIGKSDYDFFPKSEADVFWEKDELVFNRGQENINEEAFTDSKGVVHTILTKKTLYTDINSEQFIVGIIYDITEEKQIQEELIKAKEKAEENDRLKSAFLANISHEIRTPMNGILGFAELLKEPELSKLEHQTYIQVIEQSGQRMLSIINDIVDISKIEAGQMHINLSVSDINQLIRDLHTFFIPEAQNRGIQLTYSLGLNDNDCKIEMDHTKVSQVLSNLIKNALKFTHKGIINFGYKHKEHMLEFFIHDTGIGISPEQKEYIFERFVQGSTSLTRKYEGAGLGLSISKAYAEMLGGKIWVESELEKGTSFYFSIPYNPIYTSLENPKKEVSQSGSIPPLSILIVEDDENNMHYLVEIFKNSKSKIIKAVNGFEAVEMVKNNPLLDIVLMDLKIPEMDGFEATKAIKKIRPDIPVIAQTAYAFSDDKEKAIESGCDEFIAKPFKPELLYSTINKLLQK
jgi:PAS domain S-box-containing protein